jgi:hypothetical protein
MAQGEIYKAVNPLLKGNIEVGCIVGIDKKGEIKGVLIPRSAVLKRLSDTSGFDIKLTERLASYIQRGASDRQGGKLEIPSVVDLVLERFDIRNDSVHLLGVHKKSLSKGEYAGTLLKKEKEAMNFIRDVIERDIESYDRISLVTSLIYADSGVVQTGREKGGQLAATGKWIMLADSAGTGPSMTLTDTVSSGLMTMALVPNSPTLYSGKVLFEKNRCDYTAFIPLGIDNLSRKQPAKGMTCLLAEAAGVGAFFYFRSREHQYRGDAKISLDAGKIKEYNRKAGHHEKAKWASIAGAAAVYAVWDLLFDFFPREREKLPRYHSGHFQIRPYAAARDSGLVLTFNF